MTERRKKKLPYIEKYNVYGERKTKHTAETKKRKAKTTAIDNSSQRKTGNMYIFPKSCLF